MPYSHSHAHTPTPAHQKQGFTNVYTSANIAPRTVSDRHILVPPQCMNVGTHHYIINKSFIFRQAGESIGLGFMYILAIEEIRV